MQLMLKDITKEECYTITSFPVVGNCTRDIITTLVDSERPATKEAAYHYNGAK